MKIKKRYSIPLFILCIAAIGFLFYTHKPKDFERKNKDGKTISCKRYYLNVPEVYDDPKSETIEIEYVVLKSFSSNPKSPIFFLAGGPGQQATKHAESSGMLSYWSIFLEDRDVVLIDQRGVSGLKMLYFQWKWPEPNIFVSNITAKQHLDAMTQKAIKTFEKRGINLKAYNTLASAHDIDQIRKSLAYQQIIPMGFSYGTHLGQAYIKAYQNHVERAILLGVEGLDETFKLPLSLDIHFDKIDGLVQQDSNHQIKIPNLKKLYLKVAEKLENEPVELAIKTPLKTKRKVKIGKFGLYYFIKRDIGDRSDIADIVEMLYKADNGDYGLLKKFAEKRFREFLIIPAMTLSMDLSSGASVARIEQIKKEEQESIFGNIINFPLLDLHNKWPSKDLGNQFRSPLKTDLPMLLISGDLDVNTPSHQADSLMQNLANGTHLIIKNAGHEQLMYEWDTMKTMKDFLNGMDVNGRVLSYPKLKLRSL